MPLHGSTDISIQLLSASFRTNISLAHTSFQHKTFFPKKLVFALFSIFLSQDRTILCLLASSELHCLPSRFSGKFYLSNPACDTRRGGLHLCHPYPEPHLHLPSLLVGVLLHSSHKRWMASSSVSIICVCFLPLPASHMNWDYRFYI